MIKKAMVIINNRASYSRIRSVLKQLKKININLQIILKIIYKKVLWDINVKTEVLEQEIILQ